MPSLLPRPPSSASPPPSLRSALYVRDVCRLRTLVAQELLCCPQHSITSARVVRSCFPLAWFDGLLSTVAGVHSRQPLPRLLEEVHAGLPKASSTSNPWPPQFPRQRAALPPALLPTSVEYLIFSIFLKVASCWALSEDGMVLWWENSCSWAMTGLREPVPIE